MKNPDNLEGNISRASISGEDMQISQVLEIFAMALDIFAQPDATESDAMLQTYLRALGPIPSPDGDFNPGQQKLLDFILRIQLENESLPTGLE